MEGSVQNINIRGSVIPENFSTSEKTLREQLHSEIESKSKTCSNPTFECSIPRVEGSDYCHRHILRDPRSNFKQCSHIYMNGKKCTNAVKKHDIKKDPALTTLCFEHNRQMQINQTHCTVGKLKRVDTNESLLYNLSQHLSVESKVDRQTQSDGDEEIDVVSPNLPPFVNYEHIRDLETISTAIKKRKRILDYASDSSSDDEVTSITNTARSVDWIDSDEESVDSLEQDVTRHAGIYTRQEALYVSETKLTKLQGLYIDQIDRMHHILKEKRRQYLHAIRKEREILCSVHDQIKDTPRERLVYEKLKALNHYHRRYGPEAVLYKKFKEKRTRSAEGYVAKPSTFAKCIFTEGGVKCGVKSLPSCKYCKKHVLEDKKQILFRACQVDKGGVVCRDAIPCIFEDSTCVLHLQLPKKRQYIKKKDDSGTEDDDLDVANTTAATVIIDLDDISSKSTQNTKANINETEKVTNSNSSSVSMNNDDNMNITICHDLSVLKPQIKKANVNAPEKVTNSNSSSVSKNNEDNMNITICHDVSVLKPQVKKITVNAPEKVTKSNSSSVSMNNADNKNITICHDVSVLKPQIKKITVNAPEKVTNSN